MDGYWLTGNLAKVFNLPQPSGMLVQPIAAGSPAVRIGLRAGTSVYSSVTQPSEAFLTFLM